MGGADTKAKLLPCPFCGGEPTFLPNELADESVLISCPTCDFRLSDFNLDDPVATWNRRVPAADHEWFPNHTGSCPVEDDAVVILRLKNGQEIKTGCPQDWRWTGPVDDYDITAYRPAPPVSEGEG